MRAILLALLLLGASQTDGFAAGKATAATPPTDQAQLVKWCRNAVIHKYGQKGPNGRTSLPMRTSVQMTDSCVRNKGLSF